MIFSFGCYEKFYSIKLGYLSLLHLMDDSESIIGELRSVVKDVNWERDSINLLQDNNWRSHIGPAVSFLLSQHTNHSVKEEIWRSVIRGSWVSPQLLVILWITDNRFNDRINEIVNSGLSLAQGDAPSLHSEMGPGNEMSRLGKIVNAAVSLSPEIAQGDFGSEIEKIKTYDIDGAGEIALNWKQKVSNFGLL